MTINYHLIWSRPIFVLGAIGLPFAAFAASLDVSVKNKQGEMVKDAVVYVTTAPGNGSQAKGGKAIIDQRDKEFIPYVIPLKTGTAVRFPNHDNIRHHVYSFSSSKKFEIPLYKGTPAKPIVFDKPGIVVLGCNIHDWMSAYVFVSDTPFFSVTAEDGTGRIGNLSPGTYEVQVWHPRLKDKPESTGQQITVTEDRVERIAFEITQRKLWRARRAPTTTRGGYR